ncbi:MAG: hypothetical protein ACW98F_05700 [Candidatus Hodarchaeales archaeon]
MEPTTDKKADDQIPKKGQHKKDGLHPLELKYGLEPKIEPTEKWSWH